MIIAAKKSGSERSVSGDDRAVEPDIEPQANDVVGEPGMRGDDSSERGDGGRVERAQIQVEVFELPGPVAQLREGAFDAGAQGPTDVDLRTVEGSGRGKRSGELAADDENAFGYCTSDGVGSRHFDPTVSKPAGSI